jgi:hypothetical protein
MHVIKCQIIITGLQNYLLCENVLPTESPVKWTDTCAQFQPVYLSISRSG